MTAGKRQRMRADAKIVERARTAIGAYEVSAQHELLVGAVLLLAKALDDMDDEVRGRMAAETSGALLKAWADLQATCALKSSAPSGRWNDPRSRFAS